MSSAAIMSRLKLGFLTVPEFLDGWFYRLCAWLQLGTPSVLGTDLRQLTVRPDLDFVMMAAGGLMGFRTGLSILVGALLNYLVVVPLVIRFGSGDIQGVVNDQGVLVFGFRRITTWALWGGVAMMTTASLLAFLAKPQRLVTAFTGLFRRPDAQARQDVLRDIELPMRVFIIGIPLVGTLVVILGHVFFGIQYWHGAIAIPQIFVFALIGVNSTALTSINPSGAMAKLTQLTYGVLAPGNIKTNLITAGITAEVALNASNLLMLEGKPSRILRPRVLVYGSLLAAIGVALVVSVLLRVPLDVDVVRDRNSLYRETNEGWIENVYTLRVLNMDDRPHSYRVSASGIDGLTLLTDVERLAIETGQVREIAVRLQADPAVLTERSARVTFRVEAEDRPDLIATEDARFLGPGNL